MLEDPSHKPPEIKGSDGPANEHGSDSNPKVPPVSAPAKPDPSKPPESNKVACKTRRDWYDYVALVVQGMGVIFLIAYTTFAALMWCEMNKATYAAIRAANTADQSLSDARTHFQHDQRPYVAKTSLTWRPIATPNERIFVNVYLANYGKSPAIEQRGISNVFYGKSAMKQADFWFAKLHNKRLSEGSVSIIPPQIPSDPEKAPGFLTAFSDKILTKDEVDYILKTDRSAVVVAHLEYFDLAGYFYQTNICAYNLHTGAIADCEQHNDIK